LRLVALRCSGLEIANAKANNRIKDVLAIGALDYGAHPQALTVALVCGACRVHLSSSSATPSDLVGQAHGGDPCPSTGQKLC